MKKLGIIGGLGPMATAYFMEMIIDMTCAETDQEHIEMVVYNCPTIPDRTKHILDNTSPDPFPVMLDIAKKLEKEGVDVIAIPCVTATYYLERLQAEIQIPILNIMKCVVEHLSENKVKNVGLMATDGTRKTQLFEKYLTEANIKLTLPDTKNQINVMHIIYENIKAGKATEKCRFDESSEYLKSQGAEVIILGCTELSLIKKEMPLSKGYLDALQVLAQRCVDYFGVLKPEYNNLITN